MSSKDYFTYNVDCDIPSDAFRISPSQLSYFFDRTTEWYRTQLLGEQGFQGSTASELGNVVHAAANMYFDAKAVDKQALFNYIDSISDPDIDKSLIKAQLKPMIECLINNFLSKTHATDAEKFVSHQIAPGIYAAGTIDLLNATNGIIYDYKTMGSLDTARVPSSFPRNYFFQQLCYAWILTQNGTPIHTLKLVYVSRDNTGRISEKTGKPLKDYPSECNIVTHSITPEDLTMMDNIMHLMADSVKLWQSNPDLHHILAQDYRLKQPTAPILFKD